MGRRPTKAADNPFCIARLEAAKYNEKLFSKEGAAELLGVSVSTLSDYELGITKIVPPDMVLKMSDLYNAPELENYYCTSICPLGADIPKVRVENLDRISLRILDAFRKVDNVKELLVDIVADGVIDESEKPQFDKILGTLDELEQVAQSLKLWVRKNL